MRRLLWIIILLGGYVWIVTSGHDKALLEKGKWAYDALVSWFDDADIDYQLKSEKSKKHSRRWR